jgi:hypothetical protein
VLTPEQEARLKELRHQYFVTDQQVFSEIIDLLFEINEEASKYSENLYEANKELARRAEFD